MNNNLRNILLVIVLICITNKSLVAQKQTYDLSNPVIFLGSNFGLFFQGLHKRGEYDQMLVYTSKLTKEKFTKDELLSFYQNMNISFPLKLKTYRNKTMFFQTVIGATQRTIQLPINIENDTCKIIFNNIKIQSPFIGM